jgi:predicted signal transduction protein with EAL and GGDEF domain
MEVLRGLGCGAMQGFLFSRAIPPDELERWLQHTVLPRKAPWIGQASALEFSGESPRAVAGHHN